MTSERLLALIAKVHDFDQLGPADDDRFAEIERELRLLVAGVGFVTPAPALDLLARVVTEFYHALSWMPPKRRDPFYAVLRDAEATGLTFAPTTPAPPPDALPDFEAVRDALHSLPHGARCVWNEGENGCSCSKQAGLAALYRLAATPAPSLDVEGLAHSIGNEVASAVREGDEDEASGPLDWEQIGNVAYEVARTRLRAALASEPRPEREPFTGQMTWPCTCGHPKSDHYFGDQLGTDLHMHTWCQRSDGCTDFEPRPEPKR